MKELRVWWQRLAALGKKDEIGAEVADEFQFHLEMKVAELTALGMKPAEARLQAARQFGRTLALQEQALDVRGAGLLEEAWQDWRFSLRIMRRAPGRTATLVAILALGTGMSAAMFSVIRAVLLQPLPFRDAASLVILHQADHRRAGGVSYPHFRDWRAQSRAFAGMAVYSGTVSTLSLANTATRVSGATVSAGLFDLLGVHPVRGRLFRPEEDKLGGGERGSRPVLISEHLWRGRFAQREDVLGKPLVLDGVPFRIIGVIPSGHAFPVKNVALDVWTTVAVDAEPFVYGGSIPESRGYPAYDGVLARLRSGVTLPQARADAGRVADLVNRAHPKATSMNDIQVRPALEEVVGDVRPMLWLLYGAVLCVMCVSCANAAGLLLVSAIARGPEFGIRSALGARPGRLVQQMLMETVTLSLAGAVAGLLFLGALLKLFVAVAPADTPRLTGVELDGYTMLYAIAVSVGCGLLAGLAPALAGARREVATSVSHSSRSASSSQGAVRAGALLMVGQIALCTTLTCVAAIFATSFLRILNAPRGFDPHEVFTAAVDLSSADYPQQSEKVRSFYHNVLRALRSSPEVKTASIAERPPLSGYSNSTSVRVVGMPENGLPSTDLRFVDPQYFSLLRIPVLSGRSFSTNDDIAHPPVALVNRAFIRRFLSQSPGEGARLSLGWGGGGPRTVVGVVGDIKHRALDVRAMPEVYIPADQFPNNGMSFLIRTEASATDAATLLRAAVRQADSHVPLERVNTLDDLLLLSAEVPRFLLSVLSLFASSTLLIAAVGLYGVLSYANARRSREFGIRMALGSRPEQLRLLVLRKGVAMAGFGVILGLALAAASAHLLSQWLYDTAPLELRSVAYTALTLIVVALVASWIPARRAARTDPMSVLRAE